MTRINLATEERNKVSNRPTPSGLLGCAASALYILIVAPLWLYLLYQILMRVNATTAMWVAYWVYLPACLVVAIAGAFIKTLNQKD